MKKMIAMLLAFCLMAVMVPTLAETSSEEGIGLSAMLDKANSLINGEGGEGLGSLLGALGGAEGDTSEPTFTAVPAESIEQFYGTWVLSKAAIGSLEIPMEMLSLLGIKASGEMTIAENTISGIASFDDGSSEEPAVKEAEIAVEMALVDGALNVTVENETLIFQLTDAGELACAVPEIATVFFTPAA